MVAVQALLIACFAVLMATCCAVTIGFVWGSLGRPATITLLVMFAVVFVFLARVNEVG